MVRIIGNYSYQIHVHKCPVECGVSRGTPIAKGTNPIYKEGIQDTIHMRDTRFGPRSIARVLAVASGPRAWSAGAHRKLPPPPASKREQTKQINRKQAAVVALWWCTGAGGILAKHTLNPRQLCKNSALELHVAARRSAAQMRGR